MISVIIPTLGRPTLRAALDSVVGQLGPGDEVIVVADVAGDTETARNAAAVAGCVYEETATTRGVGSAQRMLGMELAAGEQLAFLDDDDTYLPGALQAMREVAYDQPVVFRAQHPLLGLIWRSPGLRYGNVSSQMFLIPNRPKLLGVWEPHTADGRGSDFTFLKGCILKMGGPTWRCEVVAWLSPAGAAAGSRVMG